jgi:DNA-binding transcriptional LysR family regulator
MLLSPARWAYFILAPVLREFREGYPDVSVIVRLEDAPLAMKAVEEGNTDLAIAKVSSPAPLVGRTPGWARTGPS